MRTASDTARRVADLLEQTLQDVPASVQPELNRGIRNLRAAAENYEGLTADQGLMTAALMWQVTGSEADRVIGLYMPVPDAELDKLISNAAAKWARVSTAPTN